MLAGLFLAALAWRLAYLARLSATPLAGTLRGDERGYWDWATVLIRNGFRGTNPFFQGPLYPYFLALARSIVGSRIQAVLVVQAVIGSSAVVLLADAARRVARPAVALTIGILLAFYEMSVLFDGLILMESLLFFLEALLIWLWCRAATRPVGRMSFALFGLVAGLIAEGRATGALLLLPGLWVAMTAQQPSRRLAMARVAAATGAFLVVAATSLIWNWSTSHEFIPFTYNLGYNLYVGNNPEANGSFVFIATGTRTGVTPEGEIDGAIAADGRAYLKKSRGLSLSPAQSSAYWTREAATFVRTHPATAAALTGMKLLMMWNREETPQLEDAELFRREAGPLGLPLVGSFLTLGTLGLIGLVFGRAPPTAAAPLRLYVLLTVLGVLPFFVTDRYRYHLVPALAVLAALAIEALFARSSAARRAKPALAIGVAAGALLLVGVPLPARPGLEEWQITKDLGIRWLEQGRPDLAAGELERAIALEHQLGLDRDPDPSVMEGRALLHFNYAAALHRLGRSDEEMAWLRRAAEEDPLNAHYLRTLADADLSHGNRAAADSILSRMNSLVGGEAEADVSRGWQAAREGRRGEAESFFRRAVARNERLYGAWAALVRIQVERSEFARAESSLANAARLGMPSPLVLAHRALIAAASGDSQGARRTLDAIPQSDIESDRMVAGVVETARRLLSQSPAARR